MNKIKQLFSKLFGFITRFVLCRKNIGVRLVFVAFYMVVCAALNVAVIFLTLFQFIVLFITTKHSDAIKTLSHKLTVYIYKMMRYMTLNENLKPYPFSPIPGEMEPAEETDLSTPLPEKEAPVADAEAGETTEPKAEEPVVEADFTEETADSQQTPGEYAGDEKEAEKDPVIPDHKKEDA